MYSRGCTLQDYTAARARLAQRAGSVENLLNTKPVASQPTTPADDYAPPSTGGSTGSVGGSTSTDIDAAWAELLAAL